MGISRVSTGELHCSAAGFCSPAYVRWQAAMFKLQMCCRVVPLDTASNPSPGYREGVERDLCASTIHEERAGVNAPTGGSG